MIEMDIDRRVQAVLHDFKAYYNIYPNRITIGDRLAHELQVQFYCYHVPDKIGELHTYCGIPVKIDYDNPDILEVGFMQSM